jgi:SWI/SNF-related matrix-associated actin-dependent regulator of chromatin subfamily A3
VDSSVFSLSRRELSPSLKMPIVDVCARKTQCRGRCGDLISKGEVRIGVEAEGSWGEYYCYYHVRCYGKKVTAENLHGFRTLPADLQYLVREQLQLGRQPAPNYVPVASPPTALASASSPADAASGPGRCNDLPDDEEENDILYGRTSVLIRGLQYYRGVLHRGEYANLIREPGNPYDHNAIKVTNMQNIQVGHIAAAKAAILQPLMDDPLPSRPRFEAVIPKPGSAYNQDCEIAIYGKPSYRDAVVSYLQTRYIHLRPWSELDRSCRGGAMTSMLSQVFRKDPAKSQAELDKLFDELVIAVDPNLLAEVGGLLVGLLVPLLAHQLEGVAWMCMRERQPDKGLPPFWERRVEMGREVYFNQITNSTWDRKPASVHGGILADDMGLGKTLQVLSVILCNPPCGITYLAPQDITISHEIAKPDAESAQRLSLELEEESRRLKRRKVPELKQELIFARLPPKGKKAELVDRLLQHKRSSIESGMASRLEGGLGALPATGSGQSARGTLIICPVSVLGNWTGQIAQHLGDNLLRVCVHHGASRARNDGDLDSFDVVITTWGTLSAEWEDEGQQQGKKRKRDCVSPLFAALWHRIVLDEAHTMRSSSSRYHKAACTLKSTYRWAVTGTPLYNKIEDIGSLFSFLRLAPVSDKNVFKRSIGRPVADGIDEGLARLRVLMKSVCLRRTKDLIKHKLPEKTVEVHVVELDAAHRDVYDSIANSARAAFKIALQGGDAAVTGEYSSVLECILRMRQAACDISLLPAERVRAAKQVLEQLEKKSAAGSAMDPKEAKILFEKLRGLIEADDGEEEMECSICLESLRDAEESRILSTCKHVFCGTCIEHVAHDAQQKGGAASCPLCRLKFTARDIQSGGALKKVAQGKEQEPVSLPENACMPPKVRALLENLRAVRDAAPNDKSVVFASFTGLLTSITPHLEEAGFRTGRIDGAMTSAKRQEVLSAFASANGPHVLLVSISAGGAGINLTSANRVYLMSPWWNSSSEEQAIDRVHRIGQTKPVQVIRYVSQGTLEPTIVELQEAKKILGMGALKKLTPSEARKARMADLRKIFEIC